MRMVTGKIREIVLEPNQEFSAWIECPLPAVPTTGRYCVAWAPEDIHAPLAVPLFPQRISENGFLTAPPIPAYWQPGTPLNLRGPCGHGFIVGENVRRLALVALGGTMARLAPLIYQSLEKNRAVAVFSDCPMPVLPSAVEVNPISALSEALGWADFLACDIPLSDLPVIKTQLKDLLVWEYQGIPGQVLCSANLPCVGLADCGVCSVYAGREWKLACKDGPVFDLQQLLK